MRLRRRVLPHVPAISARTVAPWVRSDLVSREEIPHVSERTDSAGRSQPATKPRHEITVTDESGADVGGMVDDRDPEDMSDQDWIDAAYDTEAALPSQDWIDEATPEEDYAGTRGSDLVTGSVPTCKRTPASEQCSSDSNDDPSKFHADSIFRTAVGARLAPPFPGTGKWSESNRHPAGAGAQLEQRLYGRP